MSLARMSRNSNMLSQNHIKSGKAPSEAPRLTVASAQLAVSSRSDLLTPLAAWEHASLAQDAFETSPSGAAPAAERRLTVMPLSGVGGQDRRFAMKTSRNIAVYRPRSNGAPPQSLWHPNPRCIHSLRPRSGTPPKCNGNRLLFPISARHIRISRPFVTQLAASRYP